MATHSLTGLNIITTPSPITALASNYELLAAGSADGSIRLYSPPDVKVRKAIRGLPSEIAALVFERGEERRKYLWAATGNQLRQYDTETEKMVLQENESSAVKMPVGSDDDVINQLVVNKTHIGFTTDKGLVGVMDPISFSIHFMSKKHQQLCDAVSFIPGFSRELISGGYGYKLIHHHYLYKSLLSQQDITTTAPRDTTEGNVALAPPFIHCLTVSEDGILAAGTADGRLVIGQSKPSKKPKKQWEGLKSDNLTAVKVADGPIVGMQWITGTRLILVTLSGILKNYDAESKQMEAIELKPPSAILKVNATAMHGDQFIMAGLDARGKGIASMTSHVQTSQLPITQ